MHFLNYADIYRRAEPTYSLPPFLKESIATVWNTYQRDCRNEQLFWRVEEYTRACLEENTRLADVIIKGRRAGRKEVGEFLRNELEALGFDERALNKLLCHSKSPLDSQEDE